MAARSCPTVGSDPRRSLGLSHVGVALGLWVGWLACPAHGAVYYADGKAVELVEAAGYVTVELSDQADRTAVAAELAERGMPTLVSPPSNAALGPVRLVPIATAGPGALEACREVAGIKQVRKLYVEAESGRQRIATDRIVVKFNPGTSQAEINDCLSDHGVVSVKAIQGLTRTYVVKVADPTGDAVLTAAALYEDNRTLYCHPDFIVDIHPCQVTVTDTYYTQQWHLNNTGQGGATIDADVDWPEAWNEVAGLGSIGNVVIAIHDDSVQRDHEDLAAAYLTGFDFTDYDTDPSPGWSDDRHGTCVAGVALARLNGLGVVGAAPTSSLIGIRWYPLDSDLAEGFLFALSAGADVINNSWGGYYPPDDVLRDAIQQAATTGRDGLGMIICFAAGNEYSTVEYANPVATMSEVLAIGASNAYDSKSAYSNIGPELCVVAPSNDASLTAPGIATTDVEDDANLPTTGYNDGSGTDIYGVPDLPDGSYTKNFGGTSSATPLVSGVVGLILQVNPTLTRKQVRRTLEHSADQIDTLSGAYNPLEGNSLLYGFGRANAHKAVLAAAQFGEGLSWPPPVEDLRQTGSSTVNLSWDNPLEELDTVMVVHSSSGEITWLPDGIRDETPTDYDVGDLVAPGVQIVQNKLAETFEADPGPGAHYYAVFVRNEADRWSWGKGVALALGTKSSPKASVYATPRVGAAPLTVNFSGGAVDPDLENTEFDYAWNFGDGATDAGQSVPHEYTVPGTYMARLTVTDQFELTGTALVMVRVTGKPNQPPSAQIILSPGDGEVPHTVRLQASATDTDGAITQYTWNFGDGTTAAGQIVEHTYTQAGAYAVTLEVTDNEGASAKATVSVSVWTSTGGTAKPTGGTTTTTQTQLCGTCGSLGTPALAATMLGWGLLAVRRRRR